MNTTLLAVLIVGAILTLYLIVRKPGVKAPAITERMRREGFVWSKATYKDGSKGWVETCTTCGGNCGQCGTSLGMGVPISMDHLIQATGMDKPVAGLPRY